MNMELFCFFLFAAALRLDHSLQNKQTTTPDQNTDDRFMAHEDDAADREDRKQSSRT
jgi:hypothetical protein